MPSVGHHADTTAAASTTSEARIVLNEQGKKEPAAEQATMLHLP